MLACFQPVQIAFLSIALYSVSSHSRATFSCSTFAITVPNQSLKRFDLFPPTYLFILFVFFIFAVDGEWWVEQKINIC
ncbi:hypothetical protein BDW42DRAFT_38953 [Aspergillus taichungensis]|uniref:Uncharacterized protein n=1 Tax=Aspergillus taichungensis TaxID=482145 RepID=A0A2J5HF19_9EURO|nr:hypothetical protein BDW42DRAFT_38953 [Aspergillus taichungensis]